VLDGPTHNRERAPPYACARRKGCASRLRRGQTNEKFDGLVHTRLSLIRQRFFPQEIPMRILAAVPIVALFLVAGAQAGDEALVKKELAALRGNWNVVKGAAENQDVNMQFSIVEESLRIDIGGAFKDFTIKINAAKKPKEIDIITIAPDGSDLAMLGIYQLQGDTLRICFADFGKQRPTEFKAKADSKQVHYVLKREKKQDK
jgi:uncharacterized protein (TIGR03067 family)